jgi:mono/diheme cytochrome c family protein
MNNRFTNRKIKSAALIILICSLLLHIACASARRGEPLTGSSEIPDPQVEQGQIVFMQKCHKCHPGGEAGLGPAINDKPLPEFLMRFQVRHGVGAMPSFSEEEITDAQLDDLMEYLKMLRHHDGGSTG